ncbi:MAG: UDP-2,3-diacylglucosamine diphosphatase [Planctomycetota bacterium]|nr:UDP-2,3-diacylglucosamine diphosphatase [Planctomycetota bacterium]
MATEFRSVWISDLHLGTRWTNVDALNTFLRDLSCQKLYLVGDIFDFWVLDKNWYWPTSHNEVMLNIFRISEEGTEVIYVPGNHDDIFRGYDGMSMSGIRMANSDTHTTADGRRFVVTHGDEFDRVVANHRWLAKLGARADNFIRWLSKLINDFLGRFNVPEWQAPAFFKHSIKGVCKLGSSFERSLVSLAGELGCNGVICGHVHKTALKEFDNRLYCNDGDWIDNASALVEHTDGNLELLDCKTHALRL